MQLEEDVDTTIGDHAIKKRVIQWGGGTQLPIAVNKSLQGAIREKFLVRYLLRRLLHRRLNRHIQSSNIWGLIHPVRTFLLIDLSYLIRMKVNVYLLAFRKDIPCFHQRKAEQVQPLPSRGIMCAWVVSGESNSPDGVNGAGFHQDPVGCI